MKEHGKITERQFAGIIANTMIGVGVLTMPRIAAQAAGTAGWVSLIIAGVFALFSLLFILKLGLRFPRETLMEYSPRVLGRILGKTGAGLICLYWFTASSLVFRLFAEMLVGTVLENTPIQVIFISMMVVVVYFIRHDLEVIGRINEIYFIFIIIPAVVGSMISLKNVNLIHLLPLFGSGGVSTIFKGGTKLIDSFLGFEVVMLFVPSMTTPSLVYNYGFKGWISPLAIYLAILFGAMGTFGSEELLNLTWPTLELVKVTTFPGLLLERVEVVFITFWVIAVFTTISNMVYSSVIGMTQLLKLEEHRTLIFPLTPLFYIIGMYPRHINEVFSFLSLLARGGILLVVGLPVLIYLVAVLRGIRGAETG